jgi:predicted O-methyltransferase YrrM
MATPGPSSRVGAPSFDRLPSLTPGDIADIFIAADIEQKWNARAPRLAELCRIEDGKTGGVNPGDRRALFYLVTAFHPEKLLEIGTHVGASTVYIAAALERDEPATRRRLVTVDIEDVNDGTNACWRTAGLPMSPRQMIEQLNTNIDVEFVVDSALNFFTRSKERFDLIFLDGDHSAEAVHEELIGASRSINDNGLIVLHDYFPNGLPLWSDGSILAGPFAAVEKLRSMGANISVIPLGRLPWPTKLNSNVTSLAIVAGNARNSN